jgi:hypothetical protein
MPPIRMTHNAVTAYRRALQPGTSVSGAYRELRRESAEARFTRKPPPWLRRVRSDAADGYLLLEDDVAALPVRRGRVVGCLVNPERTPRPRANRNPVA